MKPFVVPSAAADVVPSAAHGVVLSAAKDLYLTLFTLLIVAAPLGAQSIERLDPALDALIARDAKIETLATGFAWSEGPTWRREGYLVFSDVPNNTIHKWKESEGLSIFLRPAGLTRLSPFGREIGSNGLTTDARGALVMADHGNREIARLDDSLWTKTTLAARYEGKRFNSPNDLVFHSNGDIYFTDPPFGLRKLAADTAKELKYSGIFRVKPNGGVTLLSTELDFPNGIAFSPDEKTLYVSNSSATRAVWLAFPVLPDGRLGPPRTLFDATPLVKAGKKGSPDGMRVDKRGNLFASGPGASSSSRPRASTSAPSSPASQSQRRTALSATMGARCT